jgi:uncharacterized protein DUF4339
MPDYYPLIAKAVSGLDKSTGESRRALYDRARTALLGQLRSLEPAWSEPDITRERLALEEVIRKVEGEAVRRSGSGALPMRPEPGRERLQGPPTEEQLPQAVSPGEMRSAVPSFATSVKAASEPPQAEKPRNRPQHGSALSRETPRANWLRRLFGGVPSAKVSSDAVAEAEPLSNPTGRERKNVLADLTAEDGELLSQHWFVLLDGKRIGPITWKALTKAAKDGVIAAETNIWRSGWTKWYPARRVLGLLNETPSEPEPENLAGRQVEIKSKKPEKDRRDRGNDALLELARLIGQSDPFAPAQPGAEQDTRRLEAEERLRREQEAKRLEAEERLRREQEAKRLEEEERLRREQEAKRLEEEERLRREQEARRLEEEERLRREQEAKRLEEEERLRREQEAKRLEEEERLRREQEAKRQEVEKIRRQPAPEALDNILQVISFERGPGKNIRIKPGTEFPLHLPLPLSEKDHSDRLAACRSLAEDLKQELSQKQFELLSDYRDCIVRYLAALPCNSDPEYNFLPADNAARILRALFALEASTLGRSIHAKLSIFLQNHQGIRVFYPSLRRFYEDVRNGRTEEPLSLDAMMKFVAGINECTPDVFDPSVMSAFEGGSTPLPHIAAVPYDNLSTKNDPTQLGPPPDPLGEIDPQKSHDFTFASMANSLWRVLSLGKKVGDTIEGWEKAFNSLKGPFETIADWLIRFYDGGGPPTKQS